MKRTLIALSILLSASVATFAETNLKLQHFNNLTSNSALRLGDGYMYYDHMGLGDSALRMDLTKVTYDNLQNSINLSQTIDREELTRDLNVDISASGGWGMFSASASSEFVRHTEDTQFNENFTYSERYYANAVLDISDLPADTNALTPGAAELYKKYGIAGFANRYGDKFIKELPMGAFLIVNMQLHFRSSLDKEKFDNSLGGGFGSIFNASASIQTAVAQSKSRGVIEVAAYQLGGDPTELANIFDKKTSGGYYITSCSLDNLADCKGAIDGIIKYAQTDFNKQIKPTSTKPEGNLVVVGEPVLESYASKFRIFPLPPLDPAIMDQRFELSSMFRSLRSEQIFFDHFLSSPAAGYFTVAANKLLKDIQFKLNWNLSLFDQFGAYSCYMPGEETACKEIIGNIKQYQKDIDPKLINYYMNTGYFEAQAHCAYVPVGLPEENVFANFCADRWINGSFVFQMAEDKSKLHGAGDYIDQNYHLLSDANLLPQDSFANYYGTANFHNVTLGTWSQSPISVRVTKNKV